MQTPLQELLSTITRRLPHVRGLGRCILAADALFASKASPQSALLLATVNDGCKITVDGRVLEQKFAFYYGEWESELIRAAIQHYRGGSFYDVGGSIGLYAVAVGRHCRATQGIVRTFEPFPANLERLRQNLTLNDLTEEHVKVHAIALNNEPGTLRVALVADGLPGNAKVVHQGGVEVPVRTLDSVWIENGREEVGFIKIDTEGFDGQVLLGATLLLQQCRPNLLVEFNRERMNNLGFSFAEIWTWLTEELEYLAFEVKSRGSLVPVQIPGGLENILFIHKQRVPQNQIVDRV
jgi:FkbM family methyltransferase